ncbi:protein SRG1-like [Lolium rigidum]|uniref:protein SRG1-like n=1 Tax=Lolium rigidum TaxID=89674 RepID=UPI001F5CAB17|nr:protein SRG1-like [Lolium rigidum]
MSARDWKELPNRYMLREQDRHGGIPAVEEMPEPLPLVDISRLPAADEAAKLRVALENWGLFLATKHGIETSLLDALLDGGRDFFHQLPQMKQEFIMQTGGSQDHPIDWSERVRLTIEPEDERDMSRWPDYQHYFRDVMQEYVCKSKKIRDQVVRAIAMLLELEEDHLVSMFTDRAITFAVVNYYPPCPAPDGVFGFRPHSDGRVITILLADKAIGGLQVCKDGRWYNVPTKPGCLLIFVGDSLEIMSNGAFKAAFHRVVTNPVKERVSLALFFGVGADTVLEPAPALLDDTRPARYRKMRAKEYAQGILEHFRRSERMIETMKI